MTPSPIVYFQRYWLCDSFVPSVISVFVPDAFMVTLYHRKSHLDLLLASGVQSQKPFVSDADQTPKGAMLGWCSLSFYGIHIHRLFDTFCREIFEPSLPLLPVSCSLYLFFCLVVTIIWLIHFFFPPLPYSTFLSWHYINVTNQKSCMCSQALKHPFIFHTTVSLMFVPLSQACK